MLKIITALVDLLFPPRSTELTVQSYKGDVLSHYSLEQHDDIYFLSHYTHPLIKAAIKENKYHHNISASKLLAMLLTKWLEQTPSTPTYIVPIPQSKKRARERGYNQVALILEYTKLPAHIQVHNTLLTKTRHTNTQTSLQRKDRIQNIEDSFSCNKEALADIPAEATIIICDDVTTTGATLKAAQASLVPHVSPRATVLLLALAH